MDNSDRNWRLWGERDPYYAVLTDPRFRKPNIGANLQDLFGSEQIFVEHWLAQLEDISGLSRERALDFGCGVGRLTIPMCEHFGAVVGINIPSYARRGAPQQCGAGH